MGLADGWCVLHYRTLLCKQSRGILGVSEISGLIQTCTKIPLAQCPTLPLPALSPSLSKARHSKLRIKSLGTWNRRLAPSWFCMADWGSLTSFFPLLTSVRRVFLSYFLRPGRMWPLHLSSRQAEGILDRRAVHERARYCPHYLEYSG